MQLSGKNFDAVLAGLRLLQTALEQRLVLPEDGDIGDILTNSGKHSGLSVAEIDELCESLNCAPTPVVPTVVLDVEGGAYHLVTSNVPARVIILDQDTQGASGDKLMKVSGVEVYVFDYELTGSGVVEGGRADGVDASYVQERVAQINASSSIVNSCSDCGETVASLKGCPDGAEVCDKCFDSGRH
jgi:DNA-binding Xre family transcriptional regulator